MINYQATDQYGSNFRTPRPMQQDGGAAYNGFGMYDGQPNARPDGRPPGQPNAMGPDGGAMPPQRPTSSIAGSGQGAQQPPMTFSQMQQQGYARPPMPAPTPAPNQNGLAFGPPNVSFNGGNAYGQPGTVPQQPPYAPSNQPTQNGGLLFGQPNQPVTQPYSPTPPAFDAGQAVQGQYQQYQQHSGLEGAQGVANQMLQNPSPYLVPAFQSMLQKQMGQIDDQFNTRDRQTQASLAGRGLAGDGSIGLADTRYNNLLRRSAQTDATTNLYNQLAQTYGQDQARAVNTAAGLQGQQFNQGQQALQAVLGYGQQGFQNQLATAQMNNQQDQYNTQLMLALLGYGG